MNYPLTQLVSPQELSVDCPADVYIRTEAAIFVTNLAATLSLKAPKEGIGDWFRTNVNEALNKKVLDTDSSVNLLADFNALRLTSKICQIALSPVGQKIESIYLPLSDDHGKKVARHLHKHLRGLVEFMNEFEDDDARAEADKHYIDEYVRFEATDVPAGTHGNIDFNHAPKIGRIGHGVLFLNASGCEGKVFGKELIILREKPKKAN